MTIRQKTRHTKKMEGYSQKYGGFKSFTEKASGRRVSTDTSKSIY